MYTSLFLDLDNTLLDFNAAEAHAVRKVLKSHGLPHDDAAVALYTAKISKDYCFNLSEGYFKVEGADEILTYLKKRGYKLYAATNGISLTQHKRIRGSGLFKYFDGVFVSEDTGHQKPEKEYYGYIIEKIPEKDKAKILILGDSQSSDILGGINSGIDTCWYNPENKAAKYPSKYQIGALSELEKIL